jgi:hypothetical protein
MLGLLYYCYTTKLFKMWNTRFKKLSKYKTNALPLGHASALKEMLATGFEPVIVCSFCKNSLGGFRSPYFRINSPTLYRLSYERKGRATKDRTRDNWSLATKRIVSIIQNYNPMLYQLSYRTYDTGVI